MQEQRTNYDKVSSLPDFTMFPWFFVVPGVRPADGVVGDQKRVVTPRAALDAGASVLVVGRPITQAEDPDAAARAIGATL